MDILTLSQREIEYRIFDGARVDEVRGFLDAFTEEEVCMLPRHSRWDTFDSDFKDWVWNTIDGILSEPSDNCRREDSDSCSIVS